MVSDILKAYKLAVDADNEWQKELFRLFGKRSGDVRYTTKGMGDPGSVLRILHDSFMSKTSAWRIIYRTSHGY